MKSLGGDVANQGLLVCLLGSDSTFLNDLSTGASSRVKSPLCRADLGRSMLSPSRNLESTGEILSFFSGVIWAGGSRFEHADEGRDTGLMDPDCLRTDSSCVPSQYKAVQSLV